MILDTSRLLSSDTGADMGCVHALGPAAAEPDRDRRGAGAGEDDLPHRRAADHLRGAAGRAAADRRARNPLGQRPAAQGVCAGFSPGPQTCCVR